MKQKQTHGEQSENNLVVVRRRESGLNRGREFNRTHGCTYSIANNNIVITFFGDRFIQ